VLSVASADSSSLLSAFFLDRILLTHFDVVRNRYVALSMPNAVSKLPFLAAGVNAAERSVVQFPTAGDLPAARKCRLPTCGGVRHRCKCGTATNAESGLLPALIRTASRGPWANLAGTISYLGRYASVVFAEIPVLASLLSNANPNAKPVTLILALQVFFAVSRYLNQSFST
jgi:hypothetical protein